MAWREGRGVLTLPVLWDMLVSCRMMGVGMEYTRMDCCKES